MGTMTAHQLSVAMRSLPRDAASRAYLKDLLVDSKSVLQVLDTLGMKLSAAETKFLKGMPPLIDGSIRGAVLSALDPSSGSRINFDLAYRSSGSSYQLNVSAPKRTGEVDIVLLAPEPGRSTAKRARAVKQVARSKAAIRRSAAAKRKTPRRRAAR